MLLIKAPGSVIGRKFVMKIADLQGVNYQGLLAVIKIMSLPFSFDQYPGILARVKWLNPIKI